MFEIHGWQRKKRTIVCRQCGVLNDENAKFCTKCGARLNEENGKINERISYEESDCFVQKNKNKRVIVFVVLSALACVGIVLMFCIATYSHSIEQGQAAMEEGDYVSAIKAFKSATVKRPFRSEGYYLLATAYTEENDLYGAKETLKKGYQLTKEESLKRVSIWGPASVVELAYCYGRMYAAPIRVEYIFAGDRVEGYFSKHQLHEFAFEYFFDEEGRISYTRASWGGSVRGIELNRNEDSGEIYQRECFECGSYGRGDFAGLDLDGWIPYDYLNQDIFEYVYNEEGMLISANLVDEESASSNGEAAIEFEYHENQCEVIRGEFDDCIFTLLLTYDQMSRPVEIVTAGDNHLIYEYTFNEDKSYSVKKLFQSTGNILSVENYGLEGQFLSNKPSLEWMDREETVEVEVDENGKVLKMLTITGDKCDIYSYSYKSDGKLEKIEINWQYYFLNEAGFKEIYNEGEAGVVLSYTQAGELERLNYFLSGFDGYEIEREIVYDKEERCISMEQKVTSGSESTNIGDDEEWEVQYVYSDGHLREIIRECEGEKEMYYVKYNEENVPISVDEV